MDLSQPYKLVLPHLHALAIAFYLKPTPSLVIELGLGGGALPRYIKQHLSTTQLLSVEIEATIINCFERFFRGNTRSDMHLVENSDARQFMQTERQGDIIFIDLFGENATPHFLSDASFYSNCFANLRDEGLLVLNLLPNHPFQAEQLRRMLSKISGHKTLLLGIPGYKNRIIFASKTAIPPLRYSEEISSFAQTYQVDLYSFIQIG